MKQRTDIENSADGSTDPPIEQTREQDLTSPEEEDAAPSQRNEYEVGRKLESNPSALGSILWIIGIANLVYFIYPDIRQDILERIDRHWNQGIPIRAAV